METIFHIRKLTEYQVNELSKIFKEEVVVDSIHFTYETGQIMIHHRGGIAGYEGMQKVTVIPSKPTSNGESI